MTAPIFSRPALEKLQDSLKASVRKRKHEEVGVMKSAYQIIRKPIITEKGLGVKETEATLVFQVAVQGDQDRDQGSGAAIFKVKVDSVRTANFRGQGAAARQVYRLPPRLEKGVRAPEGGRKDARVRAEPVTAVRSGTSRAQSATGPDIGRL